MSKISTQDTQWPVACPECDQGKIVPTAKAGRKARYRWLVGLPVPEDFEIPTCDACGSEWIDGPIAEAMDHALERVYREKLHRSVVADLKTLGQFMTQRQLEETLGLSHGYLSKIRSGTSQPSPILFRCLRLLARDPAHRLPEIEEPLQLAS